jgi:hypothetical protein
MVGISLPSLSERDIDLLLLEELAARPTFVRWFARKCGVRGLRAKPVGEVRLRVTRSSGESDLEVALHLDDGSVHCLLIENKVTAGLQPRQSERYRARGSSYMRSGVCNGFTSVLVAPEDYLGPRPDRFGFDRIVTYELICTQLHWKATASNRVAVKDAVLTCAIGKSRLGYVPSKYDSVSAFWHVYWELCMQIAPELEMHEPGPKPPGAGFVQFFPAGLPREATLLHHKLPHGNLDLQFSGLGATMSTLRAWFGPHLESGMTVKRASASGAIRLAVPVLDTTSLFTKQKHAARRGM